MNNLKRKPLRVALIVSERMLAEYSMSLEYLLLGLADESVPVVLVCPPGSNVDSIICGAVEVLRHPPVDLPLAERLGRNMLAELLAKFEPTVLHCLCQSRAPLVEWLALRLDLPYILTVNSLQKRRRPFPASLEHCAGIVVPAQTVAASIAGFHPQFAQRIEQINAGTFVAETSRCFSVASRTATIVAAHPLDNADDFENLFGAIRHISLDGYEFMTVVMGGGRAESQVHKLLAALDLLQTVTIVPRLRPVRSVLAAGDIFVRPQPSSAFDPFLLEAMSVGVAVAACRGGVDDLIVDGETAVVFDPNDELSIVTALKQLLGKREFARKIAAAGQDYLRKNHSVSNMISATLQTYRNAEQWYKSPDR